MNVFTLRSQPSFVVYELGREPPQSAVTGSPWLLGLGKSAGLHTPGTGLGTDPDSICPLP